MNRGRHKKSKEKGFNTQAEILGTIRKELRILLAIYESQSSYNMKDYFAKAWISSNDGRDYYGITAWYINNMYCLNNFIDRVKIELNKATIKNKIYLIKFDFGSNSKTFKYKHE
jgi:hypothetical protein